MTGHIFGILLIGVLTSTLLTLWLSLGERQQAYIHAREASAVERSEQLIAAVEALPESNREAFLAAAPRLGLRVVDESFVVRADGEKSSYPSSYAAKLVERLQKVYQLQYLPGSASNCPRVSADVRSLRGPCEGILIVLEDSSRIVLSVFQPRSLLPPLNPEFFFRLIPFLLSIGALTYVVARMTTRPLKLLAQAATELGQDINRPPLKERGTTEILQATRAFNAMQGRIRQHITQRTHMLAAITHDLQTPLTRLRLRLEKVSDVELRDKLIGDLSAMQVMVKEGLDLARSMDSTDALKPLDLDSLLDSICLDASDAGQNVSLEGHSYATVMARPQDLKRCLTNLIDNAVKYGGYAKVSLQKSDERGGAWVCVFIRDGGMGIPEDQQFKVFEPFYRVEASRSRNTGGTGLGLTIAQNIAQQHGGNVSLNNLPQRGLEVRLSLPVRI